MLAWVMAFVSWLLLLVCLAVHGSTFFGIDPMERVPGVMLLHGVVLVLAFASAAMLHAREPGSLKNIEKSRMWRAAPRWMRWMLVAAFAYMFINFATFIIFNEGGTPSREGSRYTLQSHGKLIRTLTEAEFHQQQAYVVRGFSGHWLLFSLGFATLWTGAARSAKVNAIATAAPVPDTSVDDAEIAARKLDASVVTRARGWGVSRRGLRRR